MMIWMLLPNKHLSVSHRKQVNDPLYVRIETFLINLKWWIYEIFKGIEKLNKLNPLNLLTLYHFPDLVDIIRK